MRTAFAFDLDGTLSTAELLPVIADELGLEREIATLTRLTLAGTIPFEESFRLRCAILRSVPVSRVQALVSEVALLPELSLFIKEHADRCFVVTGNLDVWIRPLLDRLGCRAHTSVGEVAGDQLLGVRSILRKSDPMHEIRRDFDRVVTVGDSTNDIPMFELADIGIAAGYVHEPTAGLVRVADYVVHTEESLCRLLSTLS